MSSSKTRTKQAQAEKRADQQVQALYRKFTAVVKPRSSLKIQTFGCFFTTGLAMIGLLVGFVAGLQCMYLLMKIFPTFGVNEGLLIIGIILPLFCTCAASPLLRHFFYHLKRRHLRRNGVVAEARVMVRQWTNVPIPQRVSGDQIDLMLAWRHPETGQMYAYECRYTFAFGLSGGKRDLFTSYRSGARLPLIFSSRHPRYFALEIPATPCWFDTLF